MLAKNNARSVGKLSRAKAEISEVILAHPALRHCVSVAQGMVGCLGLWAFTWLMFLGFGGF